MKTRNGFVSNSSSSSYVVYLPKNLRFKEIGEQEALEYLIENETVFSDEDREIFVILEECLRDYVIASFDTGPDSGQITLADKSRIMEIDRMENLA